LDPVVGIIPCRVLYSAHSLHVELFVQWWFVEFTKSNPIWWYGKAILLNPYFQFELWLRFSFPYSVCLIKSSLGWLFLWLVDVENVDFIYKNVPWIVLYSIHLYIIYYILMIYHWCTFWCLKRMVYVLSLRHSKGYVGWMKKSIAHI